MNTLRRFSLSSLVLASLVAGSLVLSALHGQQASAVSSVSGTWMQTINLQGQAPFQGLVTFNADGTLSDTTQSDVMPPDLASPGHGVWASASVGTVHFRSVKFLSRAGTPGTPDGTSVVTGTLLLHNANSFQSSGVAVFYSTTGQVALTLPFTTVGKRVTLAN